MIFVELGNDAPIGLKEPAVTRWTDGGAELSVDEAFSCITGEPLHDRHTVLGSGAFKDQSTAHNAGWVDGNNDVLNARLADYYHCQLGAPADVEETHHTFSGPPGVGPTQVVGVGESQ